MSLITFGGFFPLGEPNVSVSGTNKIHVYTREPGQQYPLVTALLLSSCTLDTLNRIHHIVTLTRLS